MITKIPVTLLTVEIQGEPVTKNKPQAIGFLTADCTICAVRRFVAPAGRSKVLRRSALQESRLLITGINYEKQQ